MRPTCIFFTTIMALGAARPLLAQRFSPPRNYMDTILVEQAKRAGIDYSRAYTAAGRKDPRGLALLFRATLSTDGVGGDQHAQILLEQLHAWGDSAFSRVLREQADTVRARVRCDLDYAACADWAKQYPLTASLALRNENCVCR